jgi:putative ABC transport system permease protein
MRTALAWKNLSGDLRRLMLGALGVGFAVVLMFMQKGFQDALLDSPVQIFDLLEGDLVASSSDWYSLVSEKRFPQRLLDRASAHPDIAWVSPVYMEKARTRIRVDNHRARAIRVIGIPIRPNLISQPRVAEKLSQLKEPQTAIVDTLSKSTYGFALHDPTRLSGQRIELLGQRVSIVDTMQLGADFANDGNLLVSDTSFARYFAFRNQGRPLADVDFGLIKVRGQASGEKLKAIADQLTQLAPNQWRVDPREGFKARERNFWSAQTPVGIIFRIGVLMGFAVGVIVCYQILYTNIHDSMSELATLKAMGYQNSYFLGFVIRQSVYLSIAGFIPATAVSWVLFAALQYKAGLPMRMSPEGIAIIYGFTLAMCVVSGMLAVRKLWKADPASLF